MADEMSSPSEPESEEREGLAPSPEPIDMLRPLFREEPLPPEGGEPPKIWLWILIFGVLLFSTFYLGAFMGDFSPDPWLQSPEPVAQGAGPPEPEPVSGSQVYGARCASCHQSNGQGVSGAFPTLLGTKWVKNKGQVIRILLHGLQGEIDVKGETYNGNMPAWGSTLSDEEIAAVITHIRESWENDYGDVTPGEVASVRAATEGRSDTWSPDELEASENQTVPDDGDTTARAPSEVSGPVLYNRLVARASPNRALDRVP
ncbi:c-type cytochrome [Salinibacter altiplanensis]|uniref:c-type cytochrome n=1 Tax=Salinibacter altiplanensis TaxID=1803181 RepID=UPI000C9ECC30|nr:cytochrome c [Salinibacter altiplanensis]